MDQDEQGLAALVADGAGVEAPQTTPTEQTQTPAPEVPKEEPAAQTPTEVTPPAETPAPETQAPSQTETKVPDPIDWTAFVPTLKTDVQPPTPDENGNVDREEWSQYLIDKAKAEIRSEEAQRASINRGLDQAETILPEMKTNPKVAELVRNAAYANLVQGQAPNFIGAAQTIKDLMGGIKAEATNNANVSITTQKVAAVETGAATMPEAENKGRALADRINSNDQDAFVELMDEWQKQGVV